MSKQPTATPCRRCGREDGYVAQGCERPHRVHGYCASCYQTLHATVKAGRFRTVHDANAALPYFGNQGITLHHQYAHGRAQRRVLGRLAAIRDRAEVFIPVAVAVERQPAPLPLLTLRDGVDQSWFGQADPPWRPACWFAPLATEDAAEAA
jgi:hypothetical protein